MTTPTREPLSKTDIARICRDCYGRPRFGESEYLFAKAVERKVSADLEATIEQLRSELASEKAAALNYRADAIKAEKQRDELLEALVDLEAMAERYRPPGYPIPDAQKKARAAIASVKGVQQDNLRSFSLRLDREEWGHVIDGLILERERSLLRKSENSESNSNEISDCCAKLIGRINRACAISTLSETPIASVEGGAA